jgi:hypothetical protein
MFFDIEITEELLTVSRTPPRLTRQNGCSNLLALSNSILSLDTEVNFDEDVFRSMPDFDDLNNSSNLSNLSYLGTNNLPQLKKYNSEIKQSVKSPNLKRINTF